jgi:hypothetical protein
MPQTVSIYSLRGGLPVAIGSLGRLEWIDIGWSILVDVPLAVGSHVNQDSDEEGEQAADEGYADTGDGRAVRPKQGAADETAYQSRHRINNHHALSRLRRYFRPTVQQSAVPGSSMAWAQETGHGEGRAGRGVERVEDLNPFLEPPRKQSKYLMQSPSFQIRRSINEVSRMRAGTKYRAKVRKKSSVAVLPLSDFIL